MKTVDSVKWDLLLDSKVKSRKVIADWSSSKLSTRETTERLKNIDPVQTSEFRRLVRSSGTSYGRLLARKALKYRGV